MTSSTTIQCAIVAAICTVLILIRTLYRIFCRCKVHAKCHRQWHADDLWMTFALLPLIGRAVTISWSAELLIYPPGATAAEKASAKMLSSRLLMPGRIFYLTFLWCCKFCLMELYMRLASGLPVYRHIGKAIRWSLYLTYIGVCLATFLECRPIKIAWNGDPAGAYCRKARGNLITMAACNIVTDLALILFPISILKRAGLTFYQLLRLSVLFALGSLVIITTLIRVPLILRDDAQKTRSLWASVEICVGCFIAQAPFFQAIFVDWWLGQHSGSQVRTHTHATSRSRIGDDEIGLWKIEKRVSFSVSGQSDVKGGTESPVGGSGSSGDGSSGPANVGYRSEEDVVGMAITTSPLPSPVERKGSPSSRSSSR